MVVSDENNSTQIKPTSAQGGAVIGGRKFGMELRPNRRALSAINQNLVGAHPRPYPCVVNKRGLSETNGICDKNPPIQAHRPITRKYAAQMSTLQQPCPKEVKKPKTSANEFIVLEDTPLAGVKDNGAVKDQPVPMSLEQTEKEISENNQMEEVEMADIFEETITDIDSDDSKNPLAVVDYVEDLYKFYKKMESCSCVSPGYMAQQFDINERMRAILIDWLIEVHHKFELREETLFLTVNLIDRFLAKQTVVRKKLQLVGLVAMLLACKYEEVSVPVVDDLVLISDKAYTRKEVLDMAMLIELRSHSQSTKVVSSYYCTFQLTGTHFVQEKLMLNTLQYNMSLPTAYVFIRRFLKAAQFDRKLEQLSFFLIELCLVEYEMLRYPPSFLAAAAIYTAQCTLFGDGNWSKTCERHTTYSAVQLLDCSRCIVGFHQNSATGKLTGVHRKYNISKFEYVAKSEPANFLLVQTPPQ